MYTVFIVDDEALIRDGLKQIIDWEALGFTICGEASNGEEAEKEILEKQPDLTLMDIRMPRKLGLDVVASVREKDFKGRFIILSGYSDFKYAQEAIRYGVEFYLTKPIDEDELLSSVTTIKTALDDENRDQDTYDLLKKKARNVILHDLVTVGLERGLGHHCRSGAGSRYLPGGYLRKLQQPARQHLLQLCGFIKGFQQAGAHFLPFYGGLQGCYPFKGYLCTEPFSGFFKPLRGCEPSPEGQPHGLPVYQLRPSGKAAF